MTSSINNSNNDNLGKNNEVAAERRVGKNSLVDQSEEELWFEGIVNCSCVFKLVFLDADLFRASLGIGPFI